jgi:hypothetical protein
LIAWTAAEAKEPLMQESFATKTESEAAAAGPPADDERSLYDEQIFGALTSQSSFPLRLSVGEGGNDSWDGLPAAAQQPKVLRRRFGGKHCEFSLSADAYMIRVMTPGEAGFTMTKDSLGPQTILDVPAGEQTHVTLVAELGVKVGADSAEHCRKLFGGRKLRFARISLEGGSVYAEDRSGTRLSAAAVTVPETVEVYLSWDEHKKTLRLTDSIGLAVAVETGVYTLPAGRDGIYYLGYEPAWKVERSFEHLASK